MNFYFETQGTHTYLVYTVGENDVIESMSLGMLTNNKINGLAQTLFMQMDATKFIKYDVSAKISVKQFFAGSVNRKRLIGVFNGIVDAMLSAEDYMIDVNSILLDLDYIFADVSTCETVLICLPIISDDLSNRDLGSFFKNIMFTTQFDQTENCDHVAKIINYLNSSPVFSLIDFKKLLESIDSNINPVQVQQPIIHQPVVQQPIQQKPIAQQPIQQKPVVQPLVGQSKVNTPPPKPQPVQQQGTPEKKISMFGLLMHYSKENADLYKQQKAAKKAGGQAISNTTPVAQPKKQPASAGFVIPGQSTPVNQGFAVPGQQTNIQQTTTIQKPVQQPIQQRPVVQQPVQQPIQQKPVQQPAQTTVIAQNTYTQSQQMPQGRSMNFGETTVLGVGGGIGETTVLGVTPAVQTKPHLLRIKNNEKIDLNKPVFRIGKEKSYVDYFIGDNSAISRSHANIISRDSEYFVIDTNSTNHTYVNGNMIQSGVEMKISHGDKVKLANEEFEFKLY